MSPSTAAPQSSDLSYKRIDLHSHSTCSDGSNNPTQLLQKASDANIDIFALTDHDSIGLTSLAVTEHHQWWLDAKRHRG